MRRSRKQQGWTLQRTAYCQLIRDANKVKRLEYAQHIMESGETFHNVIFSYECSISIMQYRCTCYRRVDEPTKQKPKPKHPLKVHVWAGISRHSATNICIFDGIMDADLFCNILETTLVAFIREKLPEHRFMQILEVMSPAKEQQVIESSEDSSDSDDDTPLFSLIPQRPLQPVRPIKETSPPPTADLGD